MISVNNNTWFGLWIYIKIFLHYYEHIDLHYVTETQAKIDGDVDHFVKVGGTLRLTCRVYLGNAGPDDLYAKTAVIHWFHDQRLLDPDLENWKSSRAMPDSRKPQREASQIAMNSSNEVCD